ncbi:MAG: Phenylalanine--tRNA ligase alpha subunit [candidate division BRC1 bacterium ADurb.BinA364]|nr:MAG: Phenylalanine--tRNA ligase alpha subunit [candidate division BRC1 bacterium ADurb.BinA364]
MQKNANYAAMSPEERKRFGQAFNELKTEIESQVAEAAARAREGAAALPEIDLTLPGTARRMGALHPISLVQMELERIFYSMGFMVLTGYDVETEYYNFDALNMPSDHPSREMQDTYWLTNGLVLRTQTSANQVRALERYGAPMRAIFPGRCFRFEDVDASHENTFYQLEGLMVDRDISIANLIAVMNALLGEVFHRDLKTRLRPGYFPFVEPGFELDVQCLICGGSGCATCKRSGWIELLPCGLVHPRVLEFGKIDSSQYSGFAFGLGLTRLAMMKYGIPEIRLLNSGDIRFCEQFPAAV